MTKTYACGLALLSVLLPIGVVELEVGKTALLCTLNLFVMTAQAKTWAKICVSAEQE